MLATLRVRQSWLQKEVTEMTWLLVAAIAGVAVLIGMVTLVDHGKFGGGGTQRPA